MLNLAKEIQTVLGIMTPAERQQLKRDRRKAGLVLLQAWVPKDMHDACKTAIKVIIERERADGRGHDAWRDARSAAYDMGGTK
jgi:hypothetical protein